MASQNSQALYFSPICLPLLKFSYATVAEGISAPIPWKHISSTDTLLAVFDAKDVDGPAGATERRQKFRVVQGSEILENIDLDLLASEAQRELINPQSTQSNRVSPSITVIAKLPCVAMRFPFAGRRIRRFQVRFANAEGFYEMMKRLSKAGVPVTDAEPTATQNSSPPGLRNNPTTSLPRLMSFSDTNYRPHSMGYDSVAADHHNQPTGMSHEPHSRPATSWTPSIYGQHGDTIYNSGVYRPPSSAPSVAAPNAPRSVPQYPAAADQIGGTSTTATFHHITVPPISSAPAAQNLENIMPPKRELPFTRRAKKDDKATINIEIAPSQTSQEVQRYSSSMPNARVDPPCMQAQAEVQVEPKKSSTTKKRPVRKPSEGPASKKPKAATNRKKASLQPSRQTRPDPGIKRHVQETPRQEALESQDSRPTTDRPQSNPEIIQQCSATSESQTLPALTPTHIPRQQALVSDTVEEPGTVLVPASQDDSPDKQRSKIKTRVTEKVILTSDTLLSSDLGQAFTTSICANGYDKPDNGMSTSETKQRAIESWICQQIRSDEFLETCKMVESVWARAFVSS